MTSGPPSDGSDGDGGTSGGSGAARSDRDPSLGDGLGGSSPGEVYRAVTAVDVRYAVLAITVLAVLARLVALGARPMHYDEARVGYWILHYLESGSVAYRHGIHGPFIQHLNRWLFAVAGASDFVARLPVALAGGLLPLAVLLLREHLRRAELVVAALFLAFNSILLYYSRFMRSDVLLAAFMFVTFACLVRFYDTRRVGYLYAAAVFAAFGFASKENAIVYAVTWIGAAALLVDQALFRPRRFPTGLALARDRLGDLRVRGRELLPRYLAHGVAAVAVFLLLLVFMYADRGAGMAGIRAPPTPPEGGAVGFWEALASPLQFPGYAYETLASATEEALRWSGRTSAGDSESFIDSYTSNLGVDLEVLLSNAPALVGFAVVGFFWERYARGRSRALVLFAGYWGFVSIFGYPLADDIGSAHWLHVHFLVALSIPAAVGVARLYDWGREAAVDRDTAVTAAVTFLLVLASLQVAFVSINDVYLDTTSTENQVVQYAQPEADFAVPAGAVDRLGTPDGGTDVVVYTGAGFGGDRPLVSPPDERNHSFILRPACAKRAWYNGIPLHWYLTKADADVACATDPATLESMAAEEQPAMIVTREPDGSVPADRLAEEYVPRTFDIYQWDHRVTIYLHEDRTPAVPGWENAGDPPAEPR